MVDYTPIYVVISIFSVWIFLMLAILNRPRKWRTKFMNKFFPFRIHVRILAPLNSNEKRVISFNRVKIESKNFDMDNKSYIVDSRQIINDYDSNPMLFYENGNANPLSFKPNQKIDAIILKQQLLSSKYSKMFGSEKEAKLFWIIVICLAIIGPLIGIFFFIYNNLNNQYLELLKKISGAF